MRNFYRIKGLSPLQAFELLNECKLESYEANVQSCIDAFAFQTIQVNL